MTKLHQCGATFTDRNDEHKTLVCQLTNEHKAAHDDGHGGRWTDGLHWGGPERELEDDGRDTRRV